MYVAVQNVEWIAEVPVILDQLERNRIIAVDVVGRKTFSRIVDLDAVVAFVPDARSGEKKEVRIIANHHIKIPGEQLGKVILMAVKTLPEIAEINLYGLHLLECTGIAFPFPANFIFLLIRKVQQPL